MTNELTARRLGVAFAVSIFLAIAIFAAVKPLVAEDEIESRIAHDGACLQYFARPTPREWGIAVNEEFKRLLPNPVLLEVGESANDGTGDPMPVGYEKVLENLRRIKR